VRQRLQPGEETVVAERAADTLGPAEALEGGLVRVPRNESGDARDPAQHRRQRGQAILARPQVCAHARPRPILGAADQARADGIERDVADRGGEMRLVHRARAEAPLPEMPGAALARVDMAGIAAVHRRERAAHAVGIARHQHEVDVVRHQHPGPDLDGGSAISFITSMSDMADFVPMLRCNFARLLHGETKRGLSPIFCDLFPEERGPLGGEGKTVEIDEAYIGGLEKNKHRNKRKHAGGGGKGKEAVFSLVERGGSVRSHHVPTVNAKTLRPILTAQVSRASYLMSDDSVHSRALGMEYGWHQTVNHSIGEYVRGNAHTNTIEGYFSILKRGIHGVYHHVSPKHLKRYLTEFDFRYNVRMALGVNDFERSTKALKGVVGKRLTYRQPNQRPHL